jgi:hypothetical protein
VRVTVTRAAMARAIGDEIARLTSRIDQLDAARRDALAANIPTEGGHHDHRHRHRMQGLRRPGR